MANHHNHNQRPHHPLWGLVSSPLRILGTVAVVVILVALIAPGFAAQMAGNAMTAIASALYPFAGIIGFAFLVWLWLMARPGRNRRH